MDKKANCYLDDDRPCTGARFSFCDDCQTKNYNKRVAKIESPYESVDADELEDYQIKYLKENKVDPSNLIPVVSYDTWTIYIRKGKTELYFIDYDNESIGKVMCTNYIDYDENYNPILSEEEKNIVETENIVIEDDLHALHEGDYNGEFDDCSGFGYFKIIEEVEADE